MQSQSIRHSLAITLLALAMLPLTILGCAIVWHSYSVQKQQAITLQLETSRRVANEIYRPLDELQSDLIAAATIFNVIDMTYEEGNNLLRRLQHHANLNSGTILYKLSLVDNHGNERNKVSINDVFTKRDLTNISDQPEFIKPIQDNTNYYSPLWFDQETGDPRLTLSIPWYNLRNMQIDAVVIAELRPKELWNNAIEIKAGENGDTFILDKDYRVVAHRNPSIVLRGTTFEPPKGPGFYKGLFGNFSSIAHTTIQLGDETLYIVTQQPAKDALSLTINTTATILSALFLALILSITIGYILVRRTITPIEYLADTAKAISEGDLTRRAVVVRNDETAVLANAFNNMTERLLTMISDLEDNMIHIDHIAHFDRLTNLPNRRQLEINLGRSLAEAKRHGSFGALIFIDIDHFKNINDSLGHPVGDNLLIEVAKRLYQVVRTEDTVARLGGDEFVVVLNRISDNINNATHNAQQIAEKFRKLIAKPYDLEGTEYRTTASIGITMFPHEYDTTNELIKHADTAMYSAKSNGRNTVRFFHPRMQSAITERLALERALHEAVYNEEFILHYQPITDIDYEIIGVETLVRWPNAKQHNVNTEQFIALAEETGLIIPIGNWILKTACFQFASWRKNGIYIKDIAVNISYRQFHENDFVQQVISIIKESGIPPDCLKLEITERIMMSDIDATIDKLYQLKHQGILFSIDDFGTGYSSLSYLTRLPVDILKIDRSFVKNLPHHKEGATIVETIISMAQNLEMDVIAEGVETESQRQFLADKGCTYFQGYLFSKPQPEEQLLDMISKSNQKLRLVTNSTKGN